jgi:hypothetical protein
MIITNDNNWTLFFFLPIKANSAVAGLELSELSAQ